MKSMKEEKLTPEEDIKLIQKAKANERKLEKLLAKDFEKHLDFCLENQIPLFVLLFRYLDMAQAAARASLKLDLHPDLQKELARWSKIIKVVEEKPKVDYIV